MAGILVKTNFAVNPIAHLPRLYSLSIPTPSFDGQNSRTFQASSRETYHLAIVCTARVRTSAWEVMEYFLRWNEERVREEDLGIRARLMRKQDNKWWSFLLNDGSECKINLRETRSSPLSV
jgi:hypothetical protein